MSAKIKNLLFILILGSVSTLLLIWIQKYTFPKIEKHREMTLKSTIMDAAGIKYDKSALEESFDKYIKKEKKEGFAYYISPSKRYIFIFEGRGLWGMITGAISINPDMATLDNIKIISQEETPGLGGRIAEEGFLDQFKKKRLSPALIMTLRTKASKDNEVDAITGASLTSKAFVDMINESVANFREVVKR